MSRKWLRERSKDAWYQLAKKEGWRSRASFKLLQLDEKHHLIFEGARVVDLGAAPGGWTQVDVELAGPEGVVVGVDLDKIEPMEGATFIRGDMTSPDTVAKVMTAISGSADVVISDMSPNISGAYATDHARSVFLVENAIAFAEKVLVKEGDMVFKIFEGEDFPLLLSRVKQRFAEVRVDHPPASRKASSEAYVIAKRFKGPGKYPKPAPPREWQEGDAMPPSRKEKRGSPP